VLFQGSLRRLLGALAIAGSLIVLCVAGFRIAAASRETVDRAHLMPSGGTLVPTRSGQIHVQQQGPADGVPVVLFHGTAAWSELWRGTTDALTTSGFRVIALDLPPFGFSDRPGSYTRQQQAERVSDVLKHLGANPAIIVGHSFGAGAAIELAMRQPEQTRALVLVDAALGLTAPLTDPPMLIRPQWVREVLVSLTITNPLATRMLLQSLIARKERALPGYVEILQRPIVLRHTTTDVAAWLLYFLGADRDAISADRNAYARMTRPAAIIWGDADTVTPPAQARDLQLLLPQATLSLLPGIGHIPQIEDPDGFNAVLVAKLKTF
jgi:pimeloyl-ACP methyl ester carboxylesterase